MLLSRDDRAEDPSAVLRSMRRADLPAAGAFRAARARRLLSDLRGRRVFQRSRPCGTRTNSTTRRASTRRSCGSADSTRITSHFSNILGFPADTEETIDEQIETLRTLAPDVASFYILTPIPGTEQYEDFRREGLLTEPNLDRFDGAHVTWRHPHLSAARLTERLFESYRRFYKTADVWRKMGRLFGGPRNLRDFRLYGSLSAVLGYSMQSRWGALRRTHPMAGGIARRRLDRVEDHRARRRRVFDIDLAPLPDSLALSPGDSEINRRAKLVV